MGHRKIISVFVIFMLIAGLTGCRQQSINSEKEYKTTIMATLFPYYDFTRAIVKGVDGIDIKLLVSPGQDDHSFEPTPADVVAIDQADIFIYNGGSIETWVSDVLESLGNQNQTKVCMMDYLEEELEEIEEPEDEEQVFAVEEHGHNHENEGHTHHEEEGDDHEKGEHHHEVDEHIWTSPVFAEVLVENICNTLCEKMPEHKEIFKKNAENYVNQIKDLDYQFRSVVDQADKKEIIFADKFPLKYFALEYGLKYYAAFDGCSGEMEPSAKTVAFLIDKVKAKDVHGIFYLELSSQAMADVICDDTGVAKYRFNSCHNITAGQFEEGVTYVSLMQENLEVLKKAMNVN